MAQKRSTVASRDKLLDAALQVIRAKGYTAATVDDICAHAGLSKGSFFHHFSDKQDLAIAAAQHFSDMADHVFASASYRTLDDPRDRVLGYVAFRKALLNRAIGEFTCLLGTMVQETYATHDAIRHACATHIASHAEMIGLDIAEAKKRYAPKARWSPMSVAFHTQAVIQGAFVLAKADGDAKVAADCLDHLSNYLTMLLPLPKTKGA